MAINFFKQRWQRVLFRILVGLAALIIVVGCAINFYFSPKLDNKLKSTILSSTDSLYSLDFSKANLHVFQGKIVLDNIVLQPNLAVYNRKKKMGLAPNSLYEVKIRRLVINHIHPFTLYFKKKLDIDQLEITEPEITVNYEQNRDQDTVLANKKTPYQLISKALHSIHVQNIALNDVKLKYVEHDGSKSDISEFKELNLTATDFLLDSVSQYAKNRFLFCDDVSAELNNYIGTTDDKQYTYKIKKVLFSTRISELNLLDMSFLPNESTEAFFKRNKGACYQIRLDSLKLQHFDFKTYSKYHKLFVQTLTLNGGSLHIFANPGPSDSTINVGPNFPQLMLKKLKMDLKIDSVNANKISIFYTELNKKSGQAGTVSFTNTSGQFLNLTNNKAALQKNTYAIAKLQTWLLNLAKLDVNLSFKLGDENTPFSYKGSMAPIELKKLNPLVAPLAMLKISSGKVTKMDFDLTADQKMARGSVLILYNDLRVALLKKDDENHLKKMSILSLFANALVIKRDNPGSGEAPRVSKVMQPRKANWSMFTLMWKSLLTGLKGCAGYDSKTEETVKQKVSDFKENKATRATRKAARQQRRADRRAKRALKKQEKEEQKTQSPPTP